MILVVKRACPPALRPAFHFAQGFRSTVSRGTSVIQPSWDAPISFTRSRSRANALPVVRVGGRRSHSSSENRSPSGTASIATRSPGSAAAARRAAPATVVCGRFSATFRDSDTCRVRTETPGSSTR